MSSPAPFNDARTRIIAANLGVPISWPNEPFAKPQPFNNANVPQPWLVVRMTSDVLEPIELGGAVWQEEGRLYVDVMVPTGSGSDTARTLAKAAADVFRGVSIGPLTYLGGSIGNGITADENGEWWCLTVVIDWRYQDST